MKQHFDRNIDFAAGDLIVFTCIRNELARLPFFLDFYRSKGVDKFVVVDNASTDGTTEYLLSQSDVFSFYTDESYARSSCGMHWIEILLKRYGVGRWCVLVDADELFIYPHCEVFSLKQLCHFLDKEGTNGVRAIMLDMYADGFPILDNNLGKHMWEVFPYFDKYGEDSYYFKSLCPDNLSVMNGGVRKRVFNTSVCLQKVPLVKYSEKHHFAGSSHFIANISYSQLVECVLLHFKFDSLFQNRAREEAGRGEHWSNAKEYKQYAQTCNICPNLNLYSHNYSVRYENSQQLVQMKLMKSSQEYAAYVLELLNDSKR